MHTSPKHVMTFQTNTLRLDATHPDTYNLVGFCRCLHLWWISLLTPELSVTDVTPIRLIALGPTLGPLLLISFKLFYFLLFLIK